MLENVFLHCFQSAQDVLSQGVLLPLSFAKKQNKTKQNSKTTNV